MRCECPREKKSKQASDSVHEEHDVTVRLASPREGSHTPASFDKFCRQVDHICRHVATTAMQSRAESFVLQMGV